MIDKYGNKIGEAKESQDPGFMLSEIKFFMKGFRKEADDKKAWMIAKCIKAYLEKKGSVENIAACLSELEDYLPVSESDDFGWELVYVRRLVASYYEKEKKDSVRSGDNRLLAAKHFERICEIFPSYHNKCCRVEEYVLAILDYQIANLKDPDFLKKTGDLIAYTKDLFLQLEEGDTALYWEAGKLVYFVEQNHLKTLNANNDKCYEPQKKLAYCAHELYRRNNSEFNLKSAASFFKEYSENPNFSFAEEESRYNELIGWLEAAAPNSYELRKLLINLRTVPKQ